jgi:Tfp pilus assembly protein PilX
MTTKDCMRARSQRPKDKRIMAKVGAFVRRPSPMGFALPMTLSIILAVTIITGAVTELVASNISLIENNNKSQKALNIAEAGVNYYLWHLSHNTTDYRDGKTTPTTPDPTLGYGPYVHNYVDNNSVTSGTYTLWIKPQIVGSSLMTVTSIGKVTGSNITRTVVSQLGAPSFASYAVVADSALWFGSTESAHGPVHSNVGVRMDGASDSDVTSVNATYTPAYQNGGCGSGNCSHPGVWCDTSVVAPVNCNTRSKVDWTYPVATVDFNQVNTSLCSMKKTAFLADSSTSSLASLSNACSQVPTTRTAAYIPRRASTFAINKGYLIRLNTNGTYDLYNVNDEVDTATSYTTALTLQSVATGIALPASGIIFAEDNVWVRTNPTFHGRVTIAAGRLASTTQQANLVIADNLLYSTKNGTDAIGLVAEQDVLLAPYAPPATGAFNFEVDAALIAQSGNVEYPGTYRVSNNKCTRGWANSNQTFTFYGSVATRQTWTWTWLQNNGCGDSVYSGNSTDGYISGIYHNTTQYDYNLHYTPPPSYPITSTFDILSWREKLTHP